MTLIFGKKIDVEAIQNWIEGQGHGLKVKVKNEKMCCFHPTGKKEFQGKGHKVKGHGQTL